MAGVVAMAAVIEDFEIRVSFTKHLSIIFVLNDVHIRRLFVAEF